LRANAQTTTAHSTTAHSATDRSPLTAQEAAGARRRDDDLVEQIIALGRRISQRQYLLCRLLAEFDRRGDWALSGAVTCSRWAATVLEVETGTAREWLRVGHALEVLPEIDAAFAAGRLSFAKVRTLTRVAVDHPDRQDELIELAQRSTAGGLPWELARWTGGIEDPEARDRRHRREMGLTARTEPDGSILIIARLPPLDAAGVMTTIDAEMMSRRHSGVSVAESGADPTAVGLAPLSAPDPGSAPPRSSLGQQRAVALVDLLTDMGDGSHPSSDRGRRSGSEVIIHVRGNGSTLDDGTPIAGHLVERLAPAAFLRALIHDAESRPINASGRRRHPSIRQKRVVAERDGHVCSEPGCTATTFLEYDHEPNYRTSGRTTVDELFLRCSKHHRDRHRDDEDGNRDSKGRTG